jgi:hypothetical protein
MSTLSVATIQSANSTTDLTVRSANTSGPAIVMYANGAGFVFQGNSSANVMSVNTTSISFNSNTTINATSIATTTNTATFGTAAYVTANGSLGVGGSPYWYGSGYTDLWVQGSSYSVFDLAISSTRTGTFYANTTALTLGSITSIPLIVSTGNSERLRVDASGNVGISNTAPPTKLYVGGSAAAQVGTLTDGANIAVNLANYNNFTVTLGGSRNLDNPTNLTVGQSGIIWISQDGTGSRTLSFGSYWKFPSGSAPTLTTTATAVDAIVYTVRTSTSITAQAILNVG